MILFFLPWLDRSPVKSIRYRPDWHKNVYAVFVVFFLVLGYLGSQPPSTAGNYVSQIGTLVYFGFFLLMPWWSRSARSSRCPTASSSTPTDRQTERPLMKKLLLCVVLALSFCACLRRTKAARLGPVPRRQDDRPGRAAERRQLFANYCLNCHSASYMRYNRLHDIGLTDDEIKKNLLFATDKVGDTMKTTLDPKQAKDWFGAAPPDLSVIARSRAEVGKGSGADYLYTLWRTFYRDDTRPTGWNNLAFPNIAMPHALWQLQGERRAVRRGRRSERRQQAEHGFDGFEQITPGTLERSEYDEEVGDLVAYLQWMGEPAQNARAARRRRADLPSAFCADHLAPERGVLEGRPLAPFAAALTARPTGQPVDCFFPP